MKKILLSILLFLGVLLNAQLVKLTSGNLNFIKNEKEVNVILKFDEALFMKENYTEAQYLERRKNDLIKNPKRGVEGWNNWKKEWDEYKNVEYIKYLQRGLNKYYSKINFTTESNAKYTMLLETKWIYPGWNAGFFGGTVTAELSGTVKFFETNNPSKILAEIELNRFNKFIENKEVVMEYGRISACYQAIGKYVAAQIRRSK